MSVLVKGWSIPTNGCCGCYFRTGKYCGILNKNERVWEHVERYTRPDNCPLVELIQCKDCKYNSNTEGNYVNCDLIPQMFGKTPDDNYCSDAEPKETT